MIRLYGIANCDSVKKARVWLAARELAHEFHDFKKHGVPPDRLAAWCQSVGWQPLLNRHGTTWRKLDPATQAGAIDEGSAQAVMLAHASVIKRPVVEWGGAHPIVTVGFDVARWQALAE